MRFTTIKTIYEKAVKNKNLYFITGDLGHMYVEEFKRDLPTRYFNGGIAEQNIMGIAAGLALSGMKVVVYSIVPFITMRCFEQIKVDVCYQNLDVTIIGIGGGLIYGQYGSTHSSIEDIAVMRALPNMKILCPANPLESEQLTKQALAIKGPTYIRIGRGKEPMPSTNYNVEIGKGNIIRNGKDVTIFCTGTILDEVEKAAKILSNNKVDTEIINLHTVKPLDKKIIIDSIKTRKALFSVEEHNIIGGLGSAVAEIISENNEKKIIFKRFGVNDVYLPVIGRQDYLRARHGISAEKIANDITQMLQ